MELGLREWLAIFGMLVVAVVLSHGFWEMRRRARGEVADQRGPADPRQPARPVLSYRWLPARS